MTRRRIEGPRGDTTRLVGILCLAITHSAVWAGGPQRDSICLNGTWRFQPASGPDVRPEKGEWARLDVPTSYQWWYTLPGSAHTSWSHSKDVRSCWYEREVSVPDHWRGSRIVLGFDEIDLDAIVFVDGKRIGEVLRPEGDLDLTQHMNPGQHVLLVYVTYNYVGISRGIEQDIWMSGKRREHVRKWCNNDPEKFRASRLGLTGPVTLRAEPFAAIQDALLRTSFRRKEIGARLWVH